MADVEHEKLLKLYELAINEEHRFLNAHQNRVAFYSGILSALIAGTVAGLFQASEWYQFAILCFGPVLIFLISTIAIDGTFRLYQRFVEVVTTRAKVEQKLGLTEGHLGNSNAAHSYWQSEPLVPPRHIKSRRNSESSEAFIEKYSKRGYHLWTTRLFRGFQGISVLMFVGMLALTIWNAPCVNS
jgi:flagellar biosynthesis protein FliQ